jgi:hypothetical protein
LPGWQYAQCIQARISKQPRAGLQKRSARLDSLFETAFGVESVYGHSIEIDALVAA